MCWRGSPISPMTTRSTPAAGPWEMLNPRMSSWGIFETTRRKAEAVLKEREAARAAAIPKPEPAPGSMEYQLLHPLWKPSEE
jgi:hypothetical protein